MDRRIAKTERAIQEAFLAQRAEKPLEKIRVRELCEAAQIHKSTFYAHYPDVYALADAMESQVVEEILPAGVLPWYETVAMDEDYRKFWKQTRTDDGSWCSRCAS